MPRGGKRTGKPGTAYGQRTDLNQPYRGQPYGARQTQQAALQAVPITPPAATPVGQPQHAPGPLPGTMPDLFGPTNRPNEPLTAGIDSGPGPGSAGLRQNPDAPVLDRLRLLYAQTGMPSLGRLLENLDDA